MKKTYVYYLTTVLLSFLFTIFFYNFNFGFKLNLTYPIFFEGDSVWSLNIFNNPMRYWLGFKIDNLAFPFGMLSRDFPFLDLKNALTLAILNILKISKYNYLNYNLLNYLNFFLISLFGAYFFLKLNFNYFVAFLGTLLVNLVPYHFIRYEHILLMDYYVFFFIILLALSFIDLKKEFQISKKEIFFFSITLGISNPYYIFYFLYITFIGFLIIDKKREYLNIIKFPILIIFSLFLINILISISHSYFNGDNSGIITRQFWETLVMPITISELVLPINNILDFVTDIYIQYTEKWTSERSFHGLFLVQLGLINSIGFLISLLYLAIPQFKNKIYKKLSLFVIAVILFSSFSGISTLVSMIFPQFRTVLNIYPIILILSSTFFLYFLNNFLLKKDKYLQLFIIILLTVFTLFDFKSEKYEKYSNYNSKYEYNLSLISKMLENNIEKVFISPYFQFPEAPEFCNTNSFEPHSIPSLSEIKINYGATRERYSDKFFRLISNENVDTQVKTIINLGYNGLIIQKDCTKNTNKIKPFSVDKNLGRLIYQDENILLYKFIESKLFDVSVSPKSDLDLHYNKDLLFRFNEGVEKYHYTDKGKPFYPINNNSVSFSLEDLNSDLDDGESYLVSIHFDKNVEKYISSSVSFLQEKNIIKIYFEKNSKENIYNFKINFSHLAPKLNILKINFDYD